MMTTKTTTTTTTKIITILIILTTTKTATATATTRTITTIIIIVNDLGAPVADVVEAADVVAEELEDAAEGVADDGRPQVPHVHLLRIATSDD